MRLRAGGAGIGTRAAVPMTGNFLSSVAGGPRARLLRVQGIQADSREHRLPDAHEDGLEGGRGAGHRGPGHQEPSEQVSVARVLAGSTQMVPETSKNCPMCEALLPTLLCDSRLADPSLSGSRVSPAHPNTL